MIFVLVGLYFKLFYRYLFYVFLPHRPIILVYGPNNRPTPLEMLKICTCGIFVGHGGALVEAITLNRRVVGSTLALAAMQGPWASPLPAVACALRRETPIQYPCCSRERL